MSYVSQWQSQDLIPGLIPPSLSLNSVAFIYNVIAQRLHVSVSEKFKDYDEHTPGRNDLCFGH